MNPYLFTFLLGVFITMFLFGAIGLAFRKWYRSPMEKRLDNVDVELTRLDIRTQCFGKNIDGLINDAITDRKKFDNTDSGLQSLYEIVRLIDKDVKHLKKKAKGKAATIDAKDITPGEVIKGTELFGGVSAMPCGYETFRKAEIEGDKLVTKMRNGFYLWTDIDLVIDLIDQYAKANPKGLLNAND